MLLMWLVYYEFVTRNQNTSNLILIFITEINIDDLKSYFKFDYFSVHVACIR